MPSNPKAELTALLKARNALLWIVTREELRVERAIMEAAASASYEVCYWDCVAGLTDSQGKALDGGLRDPSQMLATIGTDTTRRVYVLRDLHKWFDPVVLRGLRSLARNLASAPRSEARAVIVLTPSAEVPLELQGCATVIDWPIPTREEMSDVLDAVLRAVPDEMRAETLRNGSRDAAIDAAMGLTADEAAGCYAKSLVTLKRIDAAAVAGEKKRVIARERVLSWTDPDPRGLDAIGGLDALKAWLIARKCALTKQARDYGLPAPKGILLVGVPGCGKSLSAKAIAAAWKIPLLRLDMGALRSKWVGESEANIRKALQVAETVAPCILWLDEIEKAMGGATQGAADGGVSADALGAILLWLQERTTPVIVVATANNIDALPPELMRKGRFDEMFFVDLPTPVERSAIARTTMAAYQRDPDTINAAQVADATAGYSGAEIAALIPEALFAAYADGARPITTDDLLTAARSVCPMSKSQSERITKLRTWAQGRCRPASTQTTTAEAAGRGTLDL